MIRIIRVARRVSITGVDVRNMIVERDCVEAPKEKSMEGKIITGHFLKIYADWLRLEPHVLAGQTVLNFGCGNSNIGKELEEKKILCNVVDVDLELTGTGKLVLVSSLLRLIDHRIDPNFNLHKKLAHLRRVFAGANGRQFIQANGRALPFQDKTFDTVLALMSTYQAPEEARELVYRELMRVGDLIHCAAIGRNDFRILEALVEKENFDIIACRRMTFGGLYKPDEFLADSISSYYDYKEKYPTEQRIQPPTENVEIFKILNYPLLKTGGVNFIVLQRRKE